jgi:hypothetical protein
MKEFYLKSETPNEFTFQCPAPISQVKRLSVFCVFAVPAILLLLFKKEYNATDIAFTLLLIVGALSTISLSKWTLTLNSQRLSFNKRNIFGRSETKNFSIQSIQVLELGTLKGVSASSRGPAIPRTRRFLKIKVSEREYLEFVIFEEDWTHAFTYSVERIAEDISELFKIKLIK